MSDAFTQRLEFAVDGTASDLFSVFRISGREAISELFRFEVLAVADSCDIEIDRLAGKQATLTIGRLGQTRRIHGIVAEIELQDITPQGQFVYRATLVPRLQRLAMSRQNQVHGTTTPVSVRDVLGHELTAGPLKGVPASAVTGRLGLDDFELRLTHEYPKREYIVQHEETDLAFISRLCEHYGIFYFFTHDAGRDIVVFGDSRVAFPAAGGPGAVAFRSASGLSNATDAAVFRFTGRSAMVPSTVCMRDYNYRLPNLTLDADETVDPHGHGVVVDYGSHFRTPQEGRDLARVRAQELAGRKRVFQGASDSVHMAAGTVFDLSDHFCDRYDGSYLLTWVEHEATQALPGIAGFRDAEHVTGYRNRFECLPKSVEFRPARTTPKPRMAGLTNAVVDAAGSGQRAEIDASGRYKIRQYFDQRGEADGQSSHSMRKAEPYGGANTGMHFPLLKGTEVILACVNGDPDRPVIVGAMQNEAHPSIVNAHSNTRNRIRTTSGTLFEIDDGSAHDGDNGAGAGTALSPQRPLEGPGPASGSPSQRLATQRAEADGTADSGTGTSPYAKMHVVAGTDSYWRLGAPDAGVEPARKPDMSNMAPGDHGKPGAGGLFEYTAGVKSSLIEASSFSRVNGDRLDYVVGGRRMSAGDHRAVSMGQYQVIAEGVSIEGTRRDLTPDSSPGEAASGDVRIKSQNNTTVTVGKHFTVKIDGDGINHTAGISTTITEGATAAIMMGSNLALTLGSSVTTVVGSTAWFFCGLRTDVGLGVEYRLRLGVVVETNMAPKISVTPTRVKTWVAKVEGGTAVVKKSDLEAAMKTIAVAQESITASTGDIDVSNREIAVLF